MDQIKVLLVDDHALFRRGVAAVLAGAENLEVVGEAKDGIEGVEKAKELTPDVVVMDLQMPHCGGVEASQALQAELPEANILILTVSDKEADLFAAMAVGAKGYILKDAEPEELIQAVVHIARGGVIVSPSMAQKLLTEFKTGEAQREETPSSLSHREGEILQCVAQGASNKEIASTLFISENTVKTHLRSILDKLHLANRSQAAAYAVRKGLVSPDQP